MTNVRISLPEPGEYGHWEDRDAGWTVWVGADGVGCSYGDGLTPAEARAFGAALIAASYEAEAPND